MNARNETSAELLMIADEPIGALHLELAVKLAGPRIELSAFKFGESRRYCTWPLELELPDNHSATTSSRLWHIAGYLYRNRATVAAIREMGCNLQLNLSGVSLSRVLSIDSGTLKKLGDLEIQLELRE